MNPEEPFPFDQIGLLPDDWDELEDGELDLSGVRRDAVGEEAA